MFDLHPSACIVFTPDLLLALFICGLISDALKAAKNIQGRIMIIAQTKTRVYVGKALEKPTFICLEGPINAMGKKFNTARILAVI